MRLIIRKEIMSKEERYIAILQFRCKVLELSGNSFEELFTCVMQQANPNFIQVKPQGKWGDKKNDGFDPTTGTFYQVYAPEDLAATETDAINKLYRDFEGLKAFWPEAGFDVKSFFYVLNDRFKGVGPAILKNVKALDVDNSDISVDIFTAAKLQIVFEDLPEERMMNVVGFIPSADISNLSLSVLHEVISHIMNSKPAPLDAVIPQNPNTLRKIEFNGLSETIANKMLVALINVNAIDDYFNNNNNFLRDDLRDRFNTYYVEAMQEFDDPDSIFMAIYNRALPPSPTKAHSDAVMTLMGYYFECCDIFKSPEQ